MSPASICRNRIRCSGSRSRRCTCTTTCSCCARCSSSGPVRVCSTRASAALREDEIAAKAMGINTRNVKLLAFAMGASFGGLSGAMFAGFQGFVSPESFTFWESVVVLGGMGHIPGVILGAVLLAVFPEFLRATMGPLQHFLFGHEIVDTEVIRQLLYGLAMVLIMLYRSEGLWPSPKHEDKLAKLAKRSGKKPVRA